MPADRTSTDTPGFDANDPERTKNHLACLRGFDLSGTFISLQTPFKHILQSVSL